MPTTDPRIAVSVLDSLRNAGLGFALLQSRAALLSSEPTGDIDIVVDTPPATALRLVQKSLESRGVALVSLWPYDVGGTATAFFLSTNGAAGAQVDMLFDPQGLGHYSVRSSELLAMADGDRLHPAVATPALTVYLLSKRTWKKQPAALAALRLELAAVPKDELTELVRRLVTSPKLATAILGRIPPRMAAKANHRVVQGQLARVVNRLNTPIGYWVHFPGNQERLARSVAERFGRVLVRSSSGRYPSGLAQAWIWYAREIQPIRLRPGLTASWGIRAPRGPSPDLSLDRPGDLDEASKGVVAAMAERHIGG